MAVRYLGQSKAVYNTKYFPTWKFKGAKTTPINREIRIDGLDPAEYEVRVTRITPVSTNTREQTKSTWMGMGEIIMDDLAYPTVALLGLKIKATGQLNGDVNVMTVVDRKYIKVFNEEGLSQGIKRLDNPAWIYWDMLTNQNYGYGLNYSQVDFDSISEWAIWCDELVNNGLKNKWEKRAVFNGVFDFEGNLWDSLCKVCTIGRASPIIRGTKYSVIVDKPSPMVQLFNMGNIKKSSLKISYIGEAELANEVEIQFVNKDKDYTNDTISVVVPEWFNDTQVKKSTIQQMGITNLSQAYRAGRYFLNCNKHIKRTAEFVVGTDAIDSEVGDVIGISHDVPAWGESGRLVSATSNSVKIDKEVDLVKGEAYVITVRLEDNSFEKFDIVFTETQTTDSLTIDGNFAVAPKQYDLYSLVEKPHAIMLFRINSITRKTDQTRKIVATEYNESVVNDSITIIEVPSMSELTSTIRKFVVSEHLEKRFDGTIVPFLDFSWELKSAFPTKNTLSLYQDGLFIKHLITDLENSFYKHNAIDLEESKEYEFKLSIKDRLSVPRDEKEIMHTLLGQSSPPPAPSRFFVDYQRGRDVKLSWEMEKPVDHKGYELRIGYSREWTLSTPIAATAEEQITLKLPSSKSLIILLKSIDLQGNLSLETRTIVINLGDKIIDNLVYTRVVNFDEDTHNGFLHVDGNLETIDENLMYSNENGDYFYVENNQDEFYKFSFTEASIVSKFTPDTAGQIMPLFKGVGEPIYFIRRYFSSQMYPSFNSNIWLDNSSLMWQKDEWKPFVTYDAKAHEIHEMKAMFFGSSARSVVSEIKYIIDAPDILEYFNDIPIMASGLHVKPAKPMNSIKNIGVTLQDDGGNAVGVKVLSKDINEGALIKVFDVNNLATSGVVDITMKGY